MRFVDQVFDKQVIDFSDCGDHLAQRGRNIQVDSPYEVSRALGELYWTYLDTSGCTVIVAYKKNLVKQNI